MKVLITMTMSASSDGTNEIVSDDTQTHGNTWAETYKGMIMLRDELNRQIADRKLCPFNPANINENGVPAFVSEA